MGGRILLGRDFVDADGQAHDQPAAGKPIQNIPDAAILSYEYWQTHFAGNPAVLGQRLSNGAGTSPLIVGVLAPGVLRLVIHEGKNRQVRRMCDAVGHPVRRLVRTRIGTLRDTGLAPGHWRELSGAEVRALAGAASASAS